MLSKYHIVTITHRNLDVEDLGQFILPENDESELKSRLESLKEKFDIEEIVYLATCNRVSFMMYGDAFLNDNFIYDFFNKINPDAMAKIGDNASKFVQFYSGLDAVDHLFEVASSVDSLVVGEREIFRQFRKAYEFSRTNHLVADNFRILEKYTVKTAKEVYDKTKIGEKPLSIVSLAIQKLLQTQREKSSRILLVGAGETNRLVGKFLKKHGFNNIQIFNRSLDNAKSLADYLNADSHHLSELKNYSGGFDIMIVCTGANDPVINEENYQNLVQSESDKKLLIDLSVPRNIDELVVRQNNTEYISIDSLRTIAHANLQDRKKEIVEAQKIIKANLESFSKIYQQRLIERALSEVPVEIRAVKERAINNVYKDNIDQLDESTRNLVLEMMDYMEKKCISVPMRLAKEVVE